MKWIALVLWLALVGCQEEDGPDKKLIYGTVGFYQMLGLDPEALKVTFRTYVEYENRIFLPLTYQFSHNENHFLQDFKPPQAEVGNVVSENKEMQEKVDKIKLYIETMQDEIAKRILLMVGFYGRIGNAFITKPQMAFVLFAAKMVNVLKLKPVSLSDKELSYEFAVMFEHGQLLFVSINVDPVVLVKALRLMQDILLNEYDNQKQYIDLMEKPDMLAPCEAKYSGKCPVCDTPPKEGFRFKMKDGCPVCGHLQPFRFKQALLKQRLRRGDEEKEKAKEGMSEAEQLREDVATLKEMKSKARRDELKKAIGQDILSKNLFNKQLIAFSNAKKGDKKIQDYLHLETMTIMQKSLKKTQDATNADLDDILKSKKFKKQLKDNQKSFLTKGGQLCAGKEEVDEDLDKKLKKMTAALEVVANAQAKVAQFYLFMDQDEAKAKENSQKAKQDKEEQAKIEGEMEESIQEKGKMDESEAKAKEKEKERQQKEKQEAQEFKQSAAKEKQEAKQRLNKLINTKNYEASLFNEQFKIMEYKHLQKNIARALERDKAEKNMFLQKFNAYFLPLMGFKAEEEVTAESLLPHDLQTLAMEKVADEELHISLCKDQILDNYLYHGNLLNNKAYTFQYLDKMHLAKEQQLIAAGE